MSSSLDKAIHTLLGGRYVTSDGEWVIVGYFLDENDTRNTQPVGMQWVEEARGLTVKEALDAFKQQSMQEILDTPIGNRQTLATDAPGNKRKRTKKRVRKSKKSRKSTSR
jgi:hypothetical protein